MRATDPREAGFDPGRLALLGEACGELGLCVVDCRRRHHVLRLQRQLPLQGLLRRGLDRLSAFELGGEHVAAASGVLQVDPGAIQLGPGDVDERIGDGKRSFGFVDLGRLAAGPRSLGIEGVPKDSGARTHSVSKGALR